MGPFSTNREKGFTLLEVVFAASILAFGIMGYTGLKISNRYSTVFAKNISQSIQIAGAELEGLLMKGFDNSLMAGDSAGITHVSTAPLVIGDFEIKTGDATWIVRDKCPSELTKLVKYTTTWNNKNVELTQVQVRP
ncbi:MAG: hypothetical protein A2511_13365 [Deltaproteobacteria bacterium RIFOXYD12_FULL_50_9]|nr:MAG: hypothetical protein A2511_13365 [Deltaproteobacteria bacterium RIFOXYD12_FULL_50_9]